MVFVLSTVNFQKLLHLFRMHGIFHIFPDIIIIGKIPVKLLQGVYDTSNDLISAGAFQFQRPCDLPKLRRKVRRTHI